jgi:hypothetical protein
MVVGVSGHGGVARTSQGLPSASPAASHPNQVGQISSTPSGSTAHPLPNGIPGAATAYQV